MGAHINSKHLIHPEPERKPFSGCHGLPEQPEGEGAPFSSRETLEGGSCEREGCIVMGVRPMGGVKG